MKTMEMGVATAKLCGFMMNKYIKFKDIECKCNLCKMDDSEAELHCSPRTSLYIRLTNECQANCKFCEYHGKRNTFNIDKFKDYLYAIGKLGILEAIKITGGEPGLELGLMEEVLEVIKCAGYNSTIELNTNGMNIAKIADMSLKYNIGTIKVSRHHYNDNINNEIFGHKMIEANEIKDIINSNNNKELIHCNCMLIKGYIDNLEEIVRYLDSTIDIGFKACGIIGLMDINMYCKEKYIDIRNIGLDSAQDKFIHKVRQFTKGNNECICKDYIYMNIKKNKMVPVFSRHVQETESNAGMLVFDGQILRQGFTGKEIKLYD